MGGAGFVLLLTAMGCPQKPGPVVPPKPAVPPPTAWATPLGIGPVTFFNDHCAQCHGQYGESLTGDSLKSVGPDEYLGVVGYMVTGPSQSSLPGPEQAALAAYCRSVCLKGTFLAVVDAGSLGGMEGEVTPGSTVRLVMGEVKLDAAVNGHRWTIDKRQVESAKAQAGPGWVSAVLVANRAGVETRLPLAEAPFIGPPHPVQATTPSTGEH